MRAGLVLAAMLPAGLIRPAVVQAQEPPCVLDKCLGQKPAEPPKPANPGAAEAQAGSASSAPSTAAPGDFDFYVLSLSWSPGFCDTGGAGKAREQCAAGP